VVAASFVILTLLMAAALKLAIGTANKGVATMANSEWIMKSARIGALLGGVAGFFYATYSVVTSEALSWAGVSDAIESVVVVLVTAAMIGSFCIAIGWLAGLFIGTVASPLRSRTEKR